MENIIMLAIAKHRLNGNKIILTGKDLVEIAQLAVHNKSVVEEAWHIRATDLIGAVKQLEDAGLADTEIAVKRSG